MSVSNVPPFANYGTLSGQLFLYAQGRAAFESSPPSLNNNSKKCILVGGLSDGLLPVPYTQELERACHDESWSLLQCILSSSYTGFGHSSLDQDCQELEELMRYLMQNRNGQEFCFVGHSTGCQDAMYFLEHAPQDLLDRLRVVALQAPVSDREGSALEDGYEQYLTMAQDMVRQGQAKEMMPRAAFWAPITAQRLVDLHARGGKDDYFSSDYSNDELVERLQHVGRRANSSSKNNKPYQVLVAYSGSDEYVPSSVDRVKLTDRLVTAMNTHCPKDQPVAHGLYIDTGNHNLSQSSGDGTRFVQTFSKLLKKQFSE